MKKIVSIFVIYIAAVLLPVLFFASCTDISVEVVYTTAETAAVSSPEPDLTPKVSPTITTTPEQTPVPTIDQIGLIIAQLSDKELIGQMVMIGFTGTGDMDDESIALMQDYYIGNVILFGWNTETFSQTKTLIEEVNSYNKSAVPLMIGIDVEGGSVTRFVGQWEPSLSSAQVLGERDDSERVYEQYKHIGGKLKEIGINIDFAPVLDIAKDPSATFLGNRMFGSDPGKVSKLACEAINGLHDGGIASLGKHFPGHGDTASDSHKTLPVIDATIDKMRGYSLIPFKAAIDGGVDAMLVAHISYPNVDDKYITSVSPYVITELLRDELGFDGVVFSDDMRMKGLSDNYPVGEAAVLHILAGGDIVLIGKNSDKQQEVLDALNGALQEGRITRERLEESVRRILEMKSKYSNISFS